ncbi:MAG: bifunctional heptose 7-phosphate kinase/heptose 1-phosphate adenyltransferase [Terriglobales bacterium]
MKASPAPLAALRPLLARFTGLRIAVWGDLVADEFISGEIARVSREAPVLILKHTRRQVALGGGANAAANLAALGIAVEVVGAAGDDEPGERVREQLAAAGIGLRGWVRVPGRPTPTKTRILAHHAHTLPQQVVRVDREPEPLGRRWQARLAALAAQAARRCQAVLISDYGYGAATPAGAARLRHQYPRAIIAVDARYQIAGYRGLTAATPNEAELEAALGRPARTPAELDRAGRGLRRRLACDHLLITRGRDGMALIEAGRPLRMLPVHGSRQALDVTGAGDTVIAVFTAALAAGASGEQAATLANVAAGLVVMKPGTATVSAGELEAALG